MRAPAIVDTAHRALAGLVVVVVLGLVSYASVLSVRPPDARGSGAPAGDFRAGRAFAQVQAIATRPHPVGSAAQDAVRDHLLASLRGMNLSPEVQDTTSVQGAELSASAGGIGLAHVRNVVTLIPGANSTGRIFLVAHYDSVQTGPGGSDDAAGVGALLEVARALTTGPRLRNDVVLVFTDGEEACLCGAEAFVSQNPLAKGGGVVLNLEARGSSGPAIMFETSTNNRKLVDLYGAAPKPVGTSFAVEIYRLLPNDTDFTAFREAGFTGLNAAFIDGAAVYHAPTDVPEAMDRDSLQHHGENTLTVARLLGDRDLRTLRGGDDATYFPAPGLLVRYPGTLVWPLAALALIAVLALGWVARKRGLTSGKKLGGAAALTLVPIILAPVLAQLYWPILTFIRPEYAGFPIDPYRPQWYRLAVIALTAVVVFGWFALFRRRLGPATLAIAGLGWLAVLGLVLAALTPGGSYLAALPALAGAICAIVAILTRGWWSVLAVTAGAAVAVIILLPTVVMLFPALGMPLGGADAFLVVLLALALLPVVDLVHTEAYGKRGLEALNAGRRGALPTAIALLAVIVLSAVGLRVDRFDATHPSLTQLMYALNADTNTAQWVSDEPKVQKWTSQFVSGDLHAVQESMPWFGSAKVRTGPATAAPLPAPNLTLERDARQGDTRTMTLRLTSQRPVRLTGLNLDPATPVLAFTVQGQPLTADQRGFVFHAPPAGGIEINLTVRASGPLRFRVMDGSDGLSDLPGFKPRPTGVGIVGSHTSELCAVAKTYSL
ncbi:M28 family peptidase [Actinoplanes sp. TBRC 11911]|uniref:M28 family peptidase n=1 Tax=Actinoplanes sp. TBRC 11911 TaxID=2729386 RepID=UPI00145E3115|nr:M28 family peptidase [Actinoplanes sp. TBRC 11911]NMO54909.1 M28 family peptidase [Actinoplanes sp. TBRC 11911]